MNVYVCFMYIYIYSYMKNFLPNVTKIISYLYDKLDVFPNVCGYADLTKILINQLTLNIHRKFESYCVPNIPVKKLSASQNIQMSMKCSKYYEYPCV